MKSITYRDLVKMLNEAGFILVRESKHKIFSNNNGLSIAVPHARVIAPGTLRDITKTINKATNKGITA